MAPINANFFDAHTHRHPYFGANTKPPAYLTPCVVNTTLPREWSVLSERFAASEINRGCSVLFACGLHPWHVGSVDVDATWRAQFLGCLDTWASAIGEIGLHRNQSQTADELTAQVDAFRWQLSVAAERNLPVSIHCVNATGQLTKILNKNSLPERGLHLHDFRGSAEVLKELKGLTIYVSIGSAIGPLTEKRKAFLCAIPDDRLLLETDQSANDTTEPQKQLHQTACALAKVRGSTVQNLLKQTNANAQRYFSLVDSIPDSQSHDIDNRI